MLSWEIVEHGKPLQRVVKDTPKPQGAEVLMRIMRPGSYSTHVVVPDAKYLLDSAGIDDSFASTLACSAVTAYSAASKLPEKIDSVAVLGCGGLGLIGISVLKARGVKNIIGCDIDD